MSPAKQYKACDHCSLEPHFVNEVYISELILEYIMLKCKGIFLNVSCINGEKIQNIKLKYKKNLQKLKHVGLKLESM